MVRQWKNRSGSRTDYWKPASVLQSHLDRIDDGTLVQVGDEKEGLWGKVNAECQDAVVSRCEIPHICERVLLDPVPRSQYLLTHQIFQQLIIDNSNCPNLQQFVSSDDEHYTKLCTKAYLEAQYLDILNVPINQRDLFAELGENSIRNLGSDFSNSKQIFHSSWILRLFGLHKFPTTRLVRTNFVVAERLWIRLFRRRSIDASWTTHHRHGLSAKGNGNGGAVRCFAD